MLHLIHCLPVFLLTLSFSFCYSMNWVSTRRPKKGWGWGASDERGKLISPGREVRRGRLDVEEQ